VRFLQLVARSVGKFTTPVGESILGDIPEFDLVEKLAVNGRVYQPWQEAAEREVSLPMFNVEAMSPNPLPQAFSFPADKQFEYLRESAEQITGVVVRERNPLCGTVEITGERVGEGLFKVSVRIRNTTPFATTQDSTRDDALLSSMVSTHTVLGVQDGRFVSLLAPPERMSEIAASCKNVGTWPVLVGEEEGDCGTLLSSPIILYDYPQIAPESAGDLFDGTEIDEILSLRIMTLTDDEKREMSQSDERARQMLERTETMPVEQFMKLHGVLRGLRPLKEESQ
jgi:hydrogenase maturation protease